MFLKMISIWISFIKKGKYSLFEKYNHDNLRKKKVLEQTKQYKYHLTPSVAVGYGN